MSLGDRPSWEQVLAECEAAAAEAEELLQARNGFDFERFAAQRAVDLRQLNLPPLPAELRDRAKSVHERQLQLQTELVTAMTSVSNQLRLSSDGGPSDQHPMYLDRSA
ncbi:MAG TPA: hypothetical protein VGH11_07975 [Jatrophihabitans sp.]|jgi:hypothetical protein